MKLINPSVELLHQDPGIKGMYEMIERCGKTSYKSPFKGGEEAVRFTQARINEGHLAVLEFGQVYLKIHRDAITFFKNSPYASVVLWGDYCYVTTNFRFIIENNLEDVMNDCWTDRTEFHKPIYCAKVITDRGVTHEMVRHRTMSFCQESTRFCNYSKDRFGSEITFIKPHWYDDAERVVKSTFESSLSYAEGAYLYLLDHQYTPQQARQVLPNALKTEICISGTYDAWQHFFRLRVPSIAETGKPHPDMAIIADSLYKEFISNGYMEPII